jgi:hypothetical protein
MVSAFKIACGASDESDPEGTTRDHAFRRHATGASL